MKLIVIFIICISTSVANAMVLVNSTPVQDRKFILDIDVDCEFNPDTNEVYNCKVVEKSDE